MCLPKKTAMSAQRACLMKLISTTSSKQFSCPDCYKVFDTQTLLRRHQWYHVDMEHRPWKCTFCAWSFVQRSELNRHFKSKHPSKQIKHPIQARYSINNIQILNSFLRMNKNRKSQKQIKSNQIKSNQNMSISESNSTNINSTAKQTQTTANSDIEMKQKFMPANNVTDPWEFVDDPKQTQFMNVAEIVNATDGSQQTQKLLNDALVTISKSCKQGIDAIQKEINTQRRRSHTAINNIDKQILALSQLKKEFKIETMQVNKEGNAQIDALSSHKEFIDKVIKSYQQSIQNGFTTTNKQDLSESEWKYHLTKIINHYSDTLQDLEKTKCEEMLNSSDPLFKPCKPVNPQQIYKIPQNDYKRRALIHNQEVMKNYNLNK